MTDASFAMLSIDPIFVATPIIPTDHWRRESFFRFLSERRKVQTGGACADVGLLVNALKLDSIWKQGKKL